MRIVLTALSAIALTLPAAAQIGAPRPSISLLAGATSYDLSGTGSAFAGGVFADYPLVRFLRAEAGAGFVRYEPQGGTTTSLLFPEIGLRLIGTVGNVQPYVGGGAGLAAVLEGTGDTDLTLHGVAGARFIVAPRLSLRGELRVRSVDPFTGTTADFMGGLTLGL